MRWSYFAGGRLLRDPALKAQYHVKAEGDMRSKICSLGSEKLYSQEQRNLNGSHAIQHLRTGKESSRESCASMMQPSGFITIYCSKHMMDAP